LAQTGNFFAYRAFTMQDGQITAAAEAGNRPPAGGAERRRLRIGDRWCVDATTPPAPAVHLHGRTPDKIIRGLNHYVALTLSRHTIYATALALRVDAARQELQWSGGGHPPAFLFRQSNLKLELLESTGLLLGAVDRDDYQTTCSATHFSPGDVLIAYTDGVSEATNPAGVQLGTAGMHWLISETCAAEADPAKWPAAILRAVLG